MLLEDTLGVRVTCLGSFHPQKNKPKRMSWRVWAESRSSSGVQKVKIHKEGKAGKAFLGKRTSVLPQSYSLPVILSTSFVLISGYKWYSVLISQYFLYLLPLINRVYFIVRLIAKCDDRKIWAACLGSSPSCSTALPDGYAISWLSMFSDPGSLSIHE